MIVMHKKNGAWEAFDERDVVAVYLNFKDRTAIETMEPDDHVYIVFPKDTHMPASYWENEARRVLALGSARDREVKSGG